MIDLELIILGALINGPMTGYDIKHLMSYTSNYFFKVSNGNLYPTLKRFESSGLVRSTELIENGRCKKVYEITEDGYQTFIDYVSKPLRPIVYKDEMLIRMYFANSFPEHILRKSLEQKLEIIDALRKDCERVRGEHQDEAQDKYKRLINKFGLELSDFMEGFFRELLDELDEPEEIETAAANVTLPDPESPR
ncbi:MAG: PadR family transcriptional regulator [Syntrophomonadaceae bacterium]|nr:PadR family transcriptional regulator [Syntrophomonadaceae bacterium]